MNSRRGLRGLLYVGGALLLMAGLIHFLEQPRTLVEREAALRSKAPETSPATVPDSTEVGNSLEGELQTSAGGFRPDEHAPAIPKPVPYRFFFSGNHSVSDAALRSQLDLPIPAPPPGEIKRLVQTDLSDFYSRRGYLDFKITGVEVWAGETTEVHVSLEEGSAYRFGRVVLRQGHSLASLVSDELPRKGEHANLSALKDVKDEIEGIFRDAGYLDFRFEFMWARDPEAEEVDLVLHLEQGERFTIREVRGEEPLPAGLAALAGRPYDRQLVERRLRQAGLQWTNVQLNRRDGSTVDLIVHNPANSPHP